MRGLLIPESCTGAVHMLVVQAQRSPPQLPPTGPVEVPVQQRPAHQPQDDRSVHAPQLPADTQGSLGLTVPESTGGGVTVPASTGGLAPQVPSAANWASQAGKGKPVVMQLPVAVEAQESSALAAP